MGEVRVEGLDKLQRGLSGVPKLYKRVVQANLMTLGGRVVYFCDLELKDVRYTGELEGSFVSDVDASGAKLTVYPTADHSIYVRMGARPHWAPIGPLKRWARWKLGDERLAYPVQRSIAERGTSVYQLRKRGTMANPWPLRVVKRGDFKTALKRTAQRIGQDIAAGVVEG